MKITSSVLALALFLAIGLSLNSSSAQSAAPQQNGAQAQTDQPTTSASDKATSIFTGKVMQDKDKGQYFLMDASTKVKYGLDDQAKAKEFEGKTVKVTGTLEAASNTIHIENIEPAA